jgi:sulfate permease
MITIHIIPLLVAMFLAINMGGSGTAPTFAAAYGANLVRKDLIPGLFGIFVFAGALIAGQKVIMTVGGDILPSETVGMTMSVIVLGSVALSLFFANMLRVPQSTSQSTIFALSGPALYLGVLQTDRLFFEIIPTWFVTPLLALVISYGVGRYIYLPLSRKIRPLLDFLRGHRALKYFVIATACYVSFAIGSNNMANAAAPVLAMAVNMLDVEVGSPNFLLLMMILVFMLAPMFGLGSSLLGHRVLQTTGKDISSFGPLGASYISVITASILLVASLWRGIPTSLVQMNTAAIIGLGMVKSGHLHVWRNAPLKKIFTIWIIAPMIAMLLSLLFVWLADGAGLLISD